MPVTRRHWSLVAGVGKVGAVLLLIVASGLIVDRLGGLTVRTEGFPRFAGLALLAASLYLEARATYVLWTQGGGTPNPVDPPRRLVKTGPYRLSRNPLYVARLGILLGASLMLGSPTIMAATLLLFGFLQAVLVPAEEAQLRQRFGAAYREYSVEVSRWISLSSMAGTFRGESRGGASRRL